MPREHLFSVTAKDCHWEYFRGSGPGGQKRHKTSSGVRVTHPPSGAVGRATETRSQRQNRKLAFRRMAESGEFQAWVKLQACRTVDVDRKVEEAMAPKNLKVEVKQDGKWQEEAP